MEAILIRSEKNGFLHYQTNEGRLFLLNLQQDNVFKLPKDISITAGATGYTIVPVPTTDGTATYRLVSTPITTINKVGGGLGRNAVINLINQFAGTGTIGGAGTLNFVAKFTPDGTTIGDSLLYDNGTTVQLGGIGAIPSAQFAMTSTTQGILLPRMTTGERNLIGAPATGLLVYNSSTSLFSYWDGAAWQNIDSQAGGDVSGSGTTNFITKWTDGPNSVIGDSIIRDDGTNIGVAASPVAGTRMYVQSAGITSATFIADFYNSAPTAIFRIRSDGHIDAGSIAQQNLSIGFSAGFNALENHFVGVRSGTDITTATGNTGFGYRSLDHVLSSPSNTAMGHAALGDQTTGGVSASPGGNVAIGSSAMRSSTTGRLSVAVGLDCLFTNVSGQDNTAVGYRCLYLNLGSYNTCMGWQCFRDSTTADENVALGYNAGVLSTTANQNTFIGTQSGFSNAGGDRNIYLGYSAGFNQAASSDLFIVDGRIRASSAEEQTNSLLYGTYASTASGTAAQYLRINGNTGIITNTFGTNADGVLGIKNGATEVSTSPADMIQIYSVNVNTAGTNLASLGLRTEEAVALIGVAIPNFRLRIKINGTEYYLLLDGV